jgi:hypothetical protein
MQKLLLLLVAGLCATALAGYADDLSLPAAPPVATELALDGPGWLPPTDDSMWVNIDSVTTTTTCQGISVYGDTIYCSYQSSAVYVYNRLTGALVRTFATGGTTLSVCRFGDSICVSLLTSPERCEVRTLSGTLARTFQPSGGQQVRGLDWDGSKFWASSYSGSLQIYTMTRTGTVLKTLTQSGGVVTPSAGRDLSLDRMYANRLWTIPMTGVGYVSYVAFDTFANTFTPLTLYTTGRAYHSGIDFFLDPVIGGCVYTKSFSGTYCWRNKVHEPLGNHDVGCTRFIYPVLPQDSGSVHTPSCSLYNFGNQTESYTVRLKIGSGYNQTVAVAGHVAGTSIYQTFPTWTAGPRGANAVSCSTELSGDANTANDKATASVFVNVHDVGATVILAPTGSVVAGTVVTPACSVYNYGNQAEGPYNVTMKIGTGYTQTAVVNPHPVGTYAYVTFPVWTAGPVGTLATSCSTRLGLDMNYSNDKATGQVTVTAPLPADIAVRTITIPDTLVYCNWDTVRVNIFNLGGLPAAPPWWLVFEDLNLSTQQLHKDSVLVTDTINAGAGRDYIFVWHPDPCEHLLTLTARYSDQNMNNNVLTKTVVVKSLDVEVNRLSIDPQGRPFQVCTWHWIDVSVHNKSVHLWDPTLYNVPIVVRVTRPGGSEALLDTIIAPRLPYCSTLVFYSDSFHLDSAGIWRIHAEVIVSGDNVPGNNYKDSTIVVTQGAVVTPGWARLTDILQGPKGKGVKDGGCVAYKPDSTGEYVYALKGNGRCEFYQYNIETNAWEAKESIPAIGSSGKKKPVKKGGTMTQAAGRMYAAKGNSTVEWWQYDPALSGTQTYPWTQKLDVPAGVKPVLKEGTGAAAVTIGDTAYVYLLRGAGGTEFLRYNTLSNTWTAMAPAPTGTSGKGYKDGSCLATDGSTTVWALKGSYNELYAYDVGTNVWVTKRPLPMTGSSGKKKKVKSGGGMARLNGSVLAQKGNNTREFWSYAADSDDWYQLEDVPLGGGKNVKPGGSICAGSTSTYSLKGNGTFEFFSYTPATFGLVQALSPKSEVQSGSPRIAHSALSVSPNPFSGTTTISYTLPTAGTASLRLYDVTGQLVATLATGSHTAGVHTLTTPTLARGIYVLKLTTDATTTTRKLIVE